MFATISLNSVHCQSGHEEEMCFPLRRAPSMRSPRGQQGPPGKLGPSGPPGPRGERGEAGKCACDPHEVEQLNRTLQKLQGKFLVWLTSIACLIMIFHTVASHSNVASSKNKIGFTGS